MTEYETGTLNAFLSDTDKLFANVCYSFSQAAIWFNQVH